MTADHSFLFMITAYNVEAFLPNLVRSLQRQTVTAWRAVFVDDCSTDDTVNRPEGPPFLARSR